MSPVISVIVPVYNVERFLQPCIDSLLAQTFQEIEFIFVNDASPDSSLQILLENKKQYPDKIQVIDSKENLCQGGARNLGLAEARGAYVGFVDPDDMVADDMYELLYQAICNDDSDVAFVQYAGISEDSVLADVVDSMSGDIAPYVRWNEKLIDASGSELSVTGRMDVMCYPIGGVVCGLWKKSTILDSGVLFPERIRYEDNYWAALLKCYITKVSFVPRVRYFYRQNSNSTTHQCNASYHFDRIAIENELLREVKSRGFFERYYSAWEYIYTFRYAFNSYSIFLTKFDTLPLREMKLIMKDLRTEFPTWWKNSYYIDQTIPGIRFINRLIAKFPILAARFYPVYKRLTGNRL